MASNKRKKKKPVSNPARGFATVSTPSKRVDEIPAKLEDNPSLPSVDGKHVYAATESKSQVALHNGDPDLQHMTPKELEQHLEEAELQNLLDIHRQHSRKDVSRQIARLETERRSLRQTGMLLETESWLHHVVEEVLELARASSRDVKSIQKLERPYNDTDLCLKLWAAQETLQSLHFHNLEGALQHLVEIAPMIAKPSSNSLVWGLDEALDWLALYSDTEDLPSYQQRSPRYTPTASRSRSSASANITGENIQSSDLSGTRSCSYSPSVNDADPGTSSSTPTIHTMAEVSDDSQMTDVSDDSDDDDPDQLIDQYISAKHELLQRSQSGKGLEQEQSATEKQAKKLNRRIQRIERDVLFDRDEAMARWNEVKNDLEVEAARSNSLAIRQKRLNKRSSLGDDFGTSSGVVGSVSATNNDADDEELFGSMFSTEENNSADSETVAAVPITIRDFGPLGAGAKPRKVLEDVCKARDASSRIAVRQISGSSHSYRHSVRVSWSKDQDVAVSPFSLPAQLSYDWQPRSVSASMANVATTSLQQSEGFLCTVMLFAISQSTKDDKVYLRLPSVWRDLWKELLEGRQQEADRADRDALKRIQALINNEKSRHKADANEPVQEETRTQGPSGMSRPLESKRVEYSPDFLKAVWEEKVSTVRYQKMLQIRQQLPIWQHCQQIIDTISVNQVTILCAETGAGKSTQVPSFILESRLKAGNDCKILVTQPRRISAISLARRVSEELGEHKSEIGTRQSLVGFAIRLESKVSSTTRITYVTTGVLLRMLESSKNLEDVDFLLLDEVHERTMDLDLLFIALRRLCQRRQNLKIVLMSATIDASRFSEYFGNAPVLNIPGRTFPVDIKYLEDAVELTRNQDDNASSHHVVENYEEDAIERNESERIRSLTVGLERYSAQTRKVLAEYDEYKIDYTLIANLVIAISSDAEFSRNSILIFMPGLAEIRRLHRTITSLPAFRGGWVIHLLHSSFSNDDLEMAFERPPVKHRKVVIATNIAETGITIPDVTAVIDSCREKVMRFDERRQLSKLTEAFISRSSARQRRGRAARVQEGLCFHLVTRYRHDNLLAEHHVPEMLRLSLQDPILRIKVWNLGDIEQTLNEAFDPPTSRNITRAIQLLKDIKALTDTESLTSIGRQLAKLPLDIWLGKLVLEGLVFACLDAMVFIAAMLSSKSPFVDSDRSDIRATAARLAFSKGNSDLLLVYNAYNAWRRACLTGNVHEFCRKNSLNHYTLSQIEDQKVQLLVTLSDTGILLLDETEKGALRRARLGGGRREFFAIPHRYTSNSSNEFAVNSVVAMALYPKLLLRERQGWRNVANNQQVNISPASINSGLSSASATWLSFYQTMQTKSKNPTVFETSFVPEAAIVILLGEAEFRMYAGVITLDSGRIRFSVHDWRTMIALKVLRTKIHESLSRSYRSTGLSLSTLDAQWLNIWQQIVTFKKASERSMQ
ncbi:hypothetical protein GJ744_001188 [Endocarpon pusillum]|uniref:RNA helicase n=1 Tax=Endocarpon pusillum TaxID=364733 RepID=A0A8H7E217_9EURO|nr:hypothetical protein GJ744_001188 [Endocarpon pusillum]